MNTGTVTSTEKSNTKHKRNYLFTVIVTILIILLIAYGYYLWRENRNVDIAVHQAIDKPVVQSEVTSEKIMDLESRLHELSEQQENIVNSLSGLYQQQPVNNEDWALAEIEYLLIIATHHLSLLHDVETALVAMEAADLRLRDMQDQQLVSVREQLASDINQLRSINIVDISSLAVYIADLIDRSDTLPLKNGVVAEQVNPESTDVTYEDSDWINVFDMIWQELKSLMIIKRNGGVPQALLLPDQEYFLFQNLRMELENARLSILRRDTENLRTSINILNHWLSQYFDTKDADVLNIVETLEYMKTVELNPKIPDINSSLETLRAYIRARETAEPMPDQNFQTPKS
ncbi:MAG: uroporphyrinogen-III C-methyltransferase [Gammaproteobacteria bacterium]|nr:uroporphyrinogen-III C-methyltransferase [Gammaproteobacteria bacterium]